MNMKRSYTMTSRADAAEETRNRIVRAMFDLTAERLFPEITLEDIANGAGVSVQTILRQFGSKAGLVAATTQYAIAAVAEERAAPVGDVDAAVRIIVEHYERRGGTALLMLAQESSEPDIATVTERGRQMHRAWVREVFAPYVGSDPALLDLLVVATDVYTWKLLRRDRGLSCAQTQQRIGDLVTAVLTATPKEH